MNYQGIPDNGVNETGTSGEGLSPGRCFMAQQHEPGRQQATARRIRRKWSQDDNKIFMECYYSSEPGRNGYRKRMHNVWISRGMFPVTSGAARIFYWRGKTGRGLGRSPRKFS